MEKQIKKTKERTFTKYQAFVIFVFAILQFTIVLDFMILSPLGAIIMDEMNIEGSQFTKVVAAYGISAFVSAILASSFADKFDRKKMLLFFYAGFILGTLFCGLAPNYTLLLAARIVTGIFGGVMSSISFAIITDLFEMKVRGRVMGFVQMAFAASQVLGIPIGLIVANKFGWHIPFIMLVVLSAIIFVVVAMKLKPVNEHLKLKNDKNPLLHVTHTIFNKRHVTGFLGTVLLATGGFMLMPLAADYSINNLKITKDQLSIVYFSTGIFTMILGPLIGKLSDSVGKLTMFIVGSIIAMIMVYIYTNLGATPLWQVVVINVIMFAGVTARMISSSALISGVPAPKDRGAFMSINSAIQYGSGGVASLIAGTLVTQAADGSYEHYNRIGFSVIGSMIVCAWMMYFINRMIKRDPNINLQPQPKPVAETSPAE